MLGIAREDIKMNKLKNLIVGVDFSPRSLAATQMAIALAEPADAIVELVHVVETQLSDSDAAVLGKSRDEILALLVDEAQTALSSFAAQLGYEKLRRTVITGSAALELAKHAEKRKVDILVVGDIGSGSSIPPRGVGVTAYRLVERGPRNVLVVKPGHSAKVSSVVAAVTFMPVANDVLRQAHLIARISRAELHVVRVIPDITELRYRLAILPSDMERIFSESVHYNESRLKEFVDKHRIHDVVVRTSTLTGKPGQALVEYLQNENIDVVVLGTGTSYRIVGYPVGSTTHRVLNQTLSSVLVVRSLEPPP